MKRMAKRRPTRVAQIELAKLRTIAPVGAVGAGVGSTAAATGVWPGGTVAEAVMAEGVAAVGGGTWGGGGGGKVGAGVEAQANRQNSADDAEERVDLDAGAGDVVPGLE